MENDSKKNLNPVSEEEMNEILNDSQKSGMYSYGSGTNPHYYDPVYKNRKWKKLEFTQEDANLDQKYFFDITATLEIQVVMRKADHGKNTEWRMVVERTKGSINIAGKSKEIRINEDETITYTTVGAAKTIPERVSDIGINESIGCKVTTPENRDITVTVMAAYDNISPIGDDYNVVGHMNCFVTNLH